MEDEEISRTRVALEAMPDRAVLKVYKGAAETDDEALMVLCLEEMLRRNIEF